MESICDGKSCHQKRAQSHIGSKAEKGAVPLFIGDVDLPEHKKCNDHCCRQTVVYQTGNGRQVEYGRTLVNKSCVNNCGYTSEKAQKPQKMVRAVIFLSKQHRKCQCKAGHTAEAVWNYTVPTYLRITENLGKPICHNRYKKQRSKTFQKQALQLFRFGILFPK